MMGARSIMIMAGGTGGHVFPALAVARALRERDYEVVWLGTRRGLEARVVPEAGFAIEWISISGLRGKGVLTWLLAPFRLLGSLFQSLRVVSRRRPGAVLGMGGFVSGPGGLASWLLRRPLIVHEQNAVAGLTNRLLARLASRVLEAFPGSFPPGIAVETVGNPVREEILAVPGPDIRFGQRSGPPRLLVFGGSQGALVLNKVVPRALAELRLPHAPSVRHQAGQATLEVASRAYEEAGVTASIEAFIEDMAAAYAWADLVICRAGAITVAELAAVGVAAILVPFPSAVDDHQTENARFLADAGAARIVAQGQLEPTALSRHLQELLGQRTLLRDMAIKARAVARPGAGRRLTDICASLAGGEVP